VRRGGSRILIVLLIALAMALAVIPTMIGRGRRVQAMRDELQAVLSQCRTKYAGARTAADSVLADEWVPPVAGTVRSGDPPCGKYRRRNMLGRAG
jgi:type II secretory pathway pseudopilin PulG